MKRNSKRNSMIVPPFGSGEVARILIAVGSRIGRLVGVGAVLLLMTSSAQAQQVYYPGSVWSSTGQLSPVEKGNVLSFTHVEQGIAFRGAELFGQSTVSVDSKGYDWNRRFLNGVGVRFTQNLPHGMVRGGVSYVRERRYTFERTLDGVVASVDAWFGWQNTPRPAGK